jgi:hypothetical protein
MGFLQGFAEGFAGVKMKQYEAEDKSAQEEDLYRKKKLIDLDISKQEAEYRAKKDAERLAAEDEYVNRTNENKTADQMGQVFTPGSAQPTPPSPFNMTPTSTNTNADFEEAQSWREKEARAAKIGSETLSKQAKIKADIADERLKFSDKERDKKRQGFKSREGMNPAEEIYKDDSSKLSKGEDDTTLYYKYFGIKKSLNPNNEEDSVAIEEALRESAKAMKLANILTEITSDNSMISDKSGGELKLDAENLTRLKTQYLAEQDPTKKEDILGNIIDISGDYPGGEEVILGELGILKMLRDQSEVQPVEISGEQTPESIRDAYKSGKLTKEQAKQKLSEIGF